MRERYRCVARRPFLCRCAARRLVPTRCPVGFLTRVAAVPGDLALRAHFEFLLWAHNLAPVVLAKRSPLQRFSAKPVKHVDCMSPLPQPMHHAGQDIRGDVVTLHVPSRHGDPGGLPHMPNLAGVGLIHVHVSGEFQASVSVAVLAGVAVLGGLAPPLYRLPLAPRDAAP